MKEISRGRLIYYTIILITAPILIYFFAVRDMRFFLVPSASMEPTLFPGDYLVTLSEDEYRRGDIVVMVDPTDPQSFIVKRIVGVAGDEVAIRGGALFINGSYASEPYVKELMMQQMEPIAVPEGGVFVLGDNRNHSEDGSEWRRALRVSSIIGKVRLRYLPVDRFGTLHGYPLINSEGF